MVKRNKRINKKSAEKLAKNSNFQVDDLVFAKMRSYCAWPARINCIKNKSVEVYFFGTHNV